MNERESKLFYGVEALKRLLNKKNKRIKALEDELIKSKLELQIRTAEVSLNSRGYLGEDRKEIQEVLDWLVSDLVPSDILDCMVVDSSLSPQEAMQSYLECNVRGDGYLVREVYDNLMYPPKVTVKFTPIGSF